MSILQLYAYAAVNLPVSFATISTPEGCGWWYINLPCVLSFSMPIYCLQQDMVASWLDVITFFNVRNAMHRMHKHANLVAQQFVRSDMFSCTLQVCL